MPTHYFRICVNDMCCNLFLKKITYDVIYRNSYEKNCSNFELSFPKRLGPKIKFRFFIWKRKKRRKNNVEWLFLEHFEIILLRALEDDLVEALRFLCDFQNKWSIFWRKCLNLVWKLNGSWSEWRKSWFTFWDESGQCAFIGNLHMEFIWYLPLRGEL